ncbi:hypothetical protein [Metabacillus sp. 84]|uniref:hypothetical protein n=1 Tax=Metabacillus sp. 84 TaxID=3404705 RepID=UPI003CEF5D56
MLEPKIFELENKLVVAFVFHHEGNAVEAEFVCSEKRIEDLLIRYNGPAELAAVRERAEWHAQEIFRDQLFSNFGEPEYPGMKVKS